MEIDQASQQISLETAKNYVSLRFSLIDSSKLPFEVRMSNNLTAVFKERHRGITRPGLRVPMLRHRTTEVMIFGELSRYSVYR